jgi:hypothetical protein
MMIMRLAVASLLAASVVGSAVHAGGERTSFEKVQKQCVDVGDIRVGEGGRWSECSVTKARWFATNDYLDLYQVQYCLGKDAIGCDERALLVFANRAYTPQARLLLQRIDPGATEYDDPVVVLTEYGRLMMLSMRSSGAPAEKSYYLWRKDRWLAVDARSWVRDLSKRLPKGASLKTADVWPDIDTMSAEATVYRKGDAGSGQVAKVELALSKERFTVKRVKFTPKAE